MATAYHEAVNATADKPTSGFQDYYEVLQLSPNADADTVNRVYRILVKRYHPDNQDTGNERRFNEIVEAYRVLADPEKRAAYDVRYDENRSTTLKIFEGVSSADSFDEDHRIFEGILSLLYVARRRDPERGGMGIIQLERFLACPSEHLAFHTWYLIEKNWIARQNNGQLAITVAGIDHMMKEHPVVLRRDRMLTETTGNATQAPTTVTN